MKQNYFCSKKKKYIYICNISTTIVKEWELKWKSESENVSAEEKKRTCTSENENGWARRA